MGLDMYLTAERYIGCWEHSGGPDKALYNDLATKIGLPGFRCEGSPSITVNVTVAYWRKANAIHSWFVRNVQDNHDDCQRVYVSREQLQRLVDDCRRVLDSVETVEGAVYTGTSYYPDGRVVDETKPGTVVAQKDIAASVLPTQNGFFFGSTDYDEYYLGDLRYTADTIAALLADKRFPETEWEFSYHASW